MFRLKVSENTGEMIAVTDGAQSIRLFPQAPEARAFVSTIPLDAEVDLGYLLDENEVMHGFVMLYQGRKVFFYG